MNLIRDAAILSLQRSNVEVLQEQLRQTRIASSVGEVTRTDVAQSESRLAAARAQMLTAESNYTTSRSTYRQVIGVEPGRLEPASPVDRLSPRNLQQGVALARARHPSVTIAMFNVDAAVFQVKIAESSLYPTLNVVGTDAEDLRLDDVADDDRIVQRVGAAGSSTCRSIRAAPNTRRSARPRRRLQQRRIDLDTARDQAQQTLVQSWGQLEAAKAQIQATQTQVNAAEIALNGVREEARVGQRTTLDVLNAQQELVNARVSLVTAQRDRVVASYALLAAAGGLSARCWRCRSRSTTRRCTTIRCATPGSACARLTASSDGPELVWPGAARRPPAEPVSTSSALRQHRSDPILEPIRVNIELMSVIRRTRPGWKPACEERGEFVRGNRR